ncbi:hypothetical protein, partial [Antarcticirhabdus aurantiaca]|uniref:hypothetical protein n=1 Tax=Antarcticirhabdus aurantiaca TaxID=2606717 RepID=UPI001AEECFDE
MIIGDTRYFTLLECTRLLLSEDCPRSDEGADDQALECAEDRLLHSLRRGVLTARGYPQRPEYASDRSMHELQDIPASIWVRTTMGPSSHEEKLHYLSCISRSLAPRQGADQGAVLTYHNDT